MRFPGRIPILLFCALALAGCAKSSGEALVVAMGVPSAKVTETSRVSMPAAGGQTIAVPQHMGDAYALWSPLSRKERMARDLGPLPPMDMRLASWLPKSEEDVMRRYLYRLTHAQSGLASRSIARAREFMPVILQTVRSQGLPEEIACLPLVESAFQPRAVSRAGAAGLWQLMPDTARRYGLTVNSRVDERFDVEKSTAAATAYLAFLYREFNDWPLAIAAYNCGEGKMRQALRASGSNSLAGLTAACRDSGSSSYLAEETLRFVPQFTAAVQVMFHGADMGFGSGPAPQVQCDYTAPADYRAHNDAEGPALVLVGKYSGGSGRNAEPPRSKRLQ